jgi:hypothetical protein
LKKAKRNLVFRWLETRADGSRRPRILAPRTGMDLIRQYESTELAGSKAVQRRGVAVGPCLTLEASISEVNKPSGLQLRTR